VLYVFGAAAILAGAQAGKSSIQGLQSFQDTQTQIGDLNQQADLVKTQYMRDERDLKREGARFLAQVRSFIARSGAAGTASESAISRAASGESARGLERLRQDKDLKVQGLKLARRNLKQSRSFQAFNLTTGIFGGAAMSVVGQPKDTPVTDLQADTAYKTRYSRVNTTTTKAGGIGHF